MRKTVAIAALVVFLAGCQGMGDKAKTGAVAGGVLGAVAGGVIGHQTGSGLVGAGIGAAVGAIAGGLIGNEMDKSDQAATQANPNHVTYASIVQRAQAGEPADAIIEDIKRTNSRYQLTSEIIDYLKKNKVSDKVIDYMLSTASAEEKK
ncbi:MAG: glycine zipper domain-containing protein [Candidatus Omnitrophota bacterium]|nr:glycine zipper domain-containing protein [Candidatus Omnitrophota bacterium]